MQNERADFLLSFFLSLSVCLLVYVRRENLPHLIFQVIKHSSCVFNSLEGFAMYCRFRNCSCTLYEKPYNVWYLCQREKRKKDCLGEWFHFASYCCTVQVTFSQGIKSSSVSFVSLDVSIPNIL